MASTCTYHDPIRCAIAVIDRVGRDLVLAIPVGIGKPNLFVNALYELAAADRKLSLRVFTGLTLVRPQYRSDLERRFIEPLLQRLFGNWPELAYAEAIRKGRLPPNVTVHDFFLQAGQWTSNALMQQSHSSLSYSHVRAHIEREGVNIISQLVAPPPSDAERDREPGYSLSSNTDVTLDLAAYVNNRRAAGAPIAVVGEVNANLPFMGGAAEVARGQFDILLEPPIPHFDLFAPPKEPVSLTDYAMALHTATLIKDGGTLQIGIGSFADALTHALILRHTQGGRFRALVERLGISPVTDAEYGHFEHGLYGCSEMLVDGFLALRRAGILKRRVVCGGRDVLIHAGFFLGSRAFYDELRALPLAARDEIAMSPISFTNTLTGDTVAKIEQRRDARFINTAIAATLLGAVASEQIEDGRVISGVGGQGDFVAMAHDLPGARSIIAVRSTRVAAAAKTTSNIRWGYPNSSIPRHLRDIVVTEYGIADIRGRPDGEVVEAMLNIADARFQPRLQRIASKAGKLRKDFKLPSNAKGNTPARIEAVLSTARRDGLLPPFPLGTEMTEIEQSLVPALGRLRGSSSLRLLTYLARGLVLGRTTGETEEQLARLDLTRPATLKDRITRLTLLGAFHAP
jgi:acyl-CoA hydrolase